MHLAKNRNNFYILQTFRSGANESMFVKVLQLITTKSVIAIKFTEYWRSELYRVSIEHIEIYRVKDDFVFSVDNDASGMYR